MLSAALRDMQWRTRRLIIAVVNTGPFPSSTPFAQLDLARLGAACAPAVVGYTTQAFREQLGAASIRELTVQRD